MLHTLTPALRHVTAAAIATISCIVVFGWLLQIPIIVQVSAKYAPMQINTALCFMLCAVLLWNKGLKTVGWPLILIASITLLQYIGDINLYIDTILLDPFITTNTSHPGRMSPNTAICFLFFGTSHVLFGTERTMRGTNYSIIFSMASIVFWGYLTGIDDILGIASTTRMGMHTSVCFMLIGSASLFDLISESEQDENYVWVPPALFIVVFALCIGVMQVIELSS